VQSYGDIMLNNKIIVICVIACFSVLGCASNGIAQSLESMEKQYKTRVSNTTLIHMNLETMFPDKKLRELASAAGKGDIRKIDEIVSSGIDVNARGNRNATALFWAIRNQNGFERLLQLGADPNVIFDDRGSVMHWLSRQNDCSMLKVALHHGGEPNLKARIFNHSPIFTTITAGKNTGPSECFEVLVQSGADINLADDKGLTPILFAAELARYDIALRLMELGADHTLKDIRGRSLMDISDGHKDAFRKGSTTEKNWSQLRSLLKG
jgi:ankyrin repeat protein